MTIICISGMILTIKKITKEWFRSFNNSEWMTTNNLLCGTQLQQTKNMEVTTLFAHSNCMSLYTRKEKKIVLKQFA